MSTTEKSAHPTNDLLFAWFYSSAIGGSAIALFFLIVDAVAGQPLYTPSLLGSALLFGATPAASVTIDLTAVALYSVVHLASFGVIGLLGAAIYQRALRRDLPTDILTGLSIFVFAEAGFLLATVTLLDGVLRHLGFVTVTVGNMVAAAAMTGFLWWAFRKTATRGVTAPDGGSRFADQGGVPTSA